MKNNNLASLVEALLIKAQQLDLICARDLIYLRNIFYFKLKVSHGDKITMINHINLSISQICQEMIPNLERNVAHALGKNSDIIEANIINTLLPLPSFIQDKFNSRHKDNGIKAALDWYYKYSCDANYIKLGNISKNIIWQSKTIYGKLDMTINLSKPEKDPHEIAWIKRFEAKNSNTNYPKCQICIENEGFSGDMHRDSRFNHRMLEIKLNNNPWFFQFSPYSYYNQHAIIINSKHQDMIINRQMFENFFSFVDQVPHYIIGSNSDIPIVGGSILTHDHYQAGYHAFPIEAAKIRFAYKIKKYPKVALNYLNWPVSTLHLIGSRSDLLKVIEIILSAWLKYNDESLNIIAKSKNHQHNTVTPIMRKLGEDQYCVYILLRNNRTNSEHPAGIFHPHNNLHHIKKENIGLIEAMGLAVLPGRLFSEISELKTLLLLNNRELAITELLFDKELTKHELWLGELYTKHKEFDSATIDSVVQTEIGNKFCQVLEDTGVFKNNPAGDNGVMKFLESLF